MNLKGNLGNVRRFVKSSVIQVYLADYNDYLSYFLDNPNLCFGVQDRLFDGGYRIYLASRRGIHPDIQMKLARWPYFESMNIKLRLARNPDICKEAQFELSRSNVVDVRASLAGNLNICKDIQMILAKDGEYYVRSILRGNKNICEEAFGMLHI